MKKILTILIALMLVGGTTAFAQSSHHHNHHSKHTQHSQEYKNKDNVENIEAEEIIIDDIDDEEYDPCWDMSDEELRELNYKNYIEGNDEAPFYDVDCSKCEHKHMEYCPYEDPEYEGIEAWCPSCGYYDDNYNNSKHKLNDNIEIIEEGVFEESGD